MLYSNPCVIIYLSYDATIANRMALELESLYHKVHALVIIDITHFLTKVVMEM